MVIFPVWVPRDQNGFADEISKFHDLDNWVVAPEIFNFFNAKWGPYDVDLFADVDNAKCNLFFAKNPSPGFAAIDAFSQNWEGLNCWMTPPVSMVSRTLRQAGACRAFGTLIVPKWKSSSFWPLLVDSNGAFKSFVRDVVEYQKPKKFFVQSNPKNIMNE